MLDTVLVTNRRALDGGLLLLRLALAAVMFPHGAQKLLGWFGGPGVAGTMHFFTGKMHIPAPLGVLVILVEFFGPLLLVVGLLTRVAALAIGIDMLVAMLTVHLGNGFFANWSGRQKGEGIEYFIYAIAIAAVVTIVGAGRYSIDARIAEGGKHV
jgi:putative oxidoreductase